MLDRRFEEAVSYASIVHGDHIRKGSDRDAGPGVPYIAHLLGVAALVLDDGGGDDEAVAAMLHDAVEDRGGLRRLEDIRRRFGDRVAALVEGCSDALPDPGAAKADWWERKCSYLEHLAHVDGDLAPALLRVSMADKLSNLRATVRDARERGDELWAIFAHGAASQLWYYGRLIDIYARRAPRSGMLPELRDLLERLDGLAPDERRLAERHRAERCPEGGAG